MRSPIEGALPIVAAAIGEQFGINVVLGSDARTNGQTIWLPALTDPALHPVLWGYLGHEAAHIRFTDFEVGHDLSRAEFKLCNILEDCRIEKALQEVYPGTRTTLRGLWSYLHSAGLLQPVSATDTEVVQFLGYLLFRCRFMQWGTDELKDYYERAQAVVENTFPAGFFVRLEALLGTYFDSMDSTADCARLAEAILRALKEAEEEAAQSSQDSSQESSGDDDQDSDSADSSSGASSASDAETAGEGQDASGQGQPSESITDADGDSDGQSQPDADASSEGAGGSGADDASASPLSDAILSSGDLPDDVMDALAAALSSEEKDSDAERMGGMLITPGAELSQGHADSSALSEGLLQSSRLRASLTSLLQAQSRSRRTLARSGRRFESQRLARVATGDTQIFRRQQVRQRTDTAVHLLLDRSGSMGAIQHVANQAAVAMALAMTSLPKVSVAVSVFPGLRGEVSPLIYRGMPVRPNIERFAQHASGGTPLAEAMLFAARDLAASHASRKVMVVVTDGTPNCPAGVRYVNRLCEGQIDRYAIGIAHNGVRNFFEHSVILNDVSELQSALFELSAKFLEVA